MKALHNIKICPVRHKSALRILVEYLGYDWPVKDIKLLHDMRIETLNGRKRKTFGEQLKDIEDLGYWAFCRRERGKHPGELHYWLGDKISDAKLVSVFAHELAHMVGYSSELAAEKIADIAGFAHQLTKGVNHARP